MTIPFHDQDHARLWARRGFVIVPMLGDEDVSRLRAASTPADDIVRFPFSATIMSRDVDDRLRISRELQALLQPKIDAIVDGYRVCFGNYTFKPAAQTGGGVELHQDWSFVDEALGEPLGLWCPLVPVTPENGCLFVVPGSHRLTRHPRSVHARFHHPEIDSVLDRVLTPLAMRAGDAVLFSQRLFHTSPPNRSDRARPVACAVLAPRSSPCRCYYPDPANAGDLLVFEVDDDFYTRYRIGNRPDGEPVGTVRVAPERLSAEDLLHAVREADGP